MTDTRVPEQLGRYRILRRLAQGGMAEILLAEAADLPEVRRVVVLKRLLPGLAQDDSSRALFLNEARIMASLNHPNVVQVLEVFRSDDELFIAMEHLDGETLGGFVDANEVAARRIPLEESLYIIAQVLAGLDYVHERRDSDGQPMQLIHRDISRRNVLLTYDGGVKVIDFGIARRANVLGATAAGIVRGTIAYMSPEQARGLHLDRRCDLFAVGTLLYELAVGAEAYSGDSDFDVLKQIIEGPIPDPTRVVAGFPPVLHEVIARAQQKKPADRFQTAAQMLAAVENAAAALGLPLSATTLKPTMQSLFREHIEAWGVLRRDDGAHRDKALATLTASGGLAFAEEAAVAVAPTELAARPPSRKAPIVLGLLAAAALSGGLAWWSGGRHSTPTPAAVDMALDRDGAVPRDAAQPPDAALVFVPQPIANKHRQHEAHGKGQLVLEAHPWCDVTIDGSSLGPTPLVVPLPSGVHKVHLRNREFDIDRTITLTLRPGQTLKKKLEFPPKRR